MTLDAYVDVGKRVSIIKVDVEGLELRVFQGAERILRESSPLVVFESENRHLEHGSVDDVLNYLYERGYDGHFVHRGRLIPARQFDAVSRQEEIGDRFFANRDYCNNFIFHKTAHANRCRVRQ